MNQKPKKKKWSPPKPEIEPLPEVVPTCRQFFTQACPHCSGTGTTAHTPGGWWIDWHYQDCHEQEGPLTKTQAIKTICQHKDGSCRPTLIGPDGTVYEIPELEKRKSKKSRGAI